jgi:predicted phage tail protein
MAVVSLLGDLRQFGGPYTFDAATPLDIVSALCHQLKGFKKRVIAGQFRVLHRRKGREVELCHATLDIRLQQDSEVVIVPVASGAGQKSGVGKIIMGAVLVAAAVVTSGAAAAAYGMATGVAGTGLSGLMGLSTGFLGITYAQIAGFGATMLLTGIYQTFMGGSTNTSTKAGQDANASYLFSGPVNASKQGSAKPLVFGRFVCGSVVVSSDLSAERI